LSNLWRQVQGGDKLLGGIAIREPSLRPLFCRQGNKYLHRKDIIPIIPPHKRYVELFVCSGAIFGSKEKAQETILNDLYKGTTKGFNLIKKTSLDMDTYREDLNSLSKIKVFWDSEPHTNEDKVIREIIRTCYGFGGMPVTKSKRIYKDHNPLNKLKRSLESWKDALEDTK
jgi:hypothetical protein